MRDSNGSKSITKNELYGAFNLNIGKGTDGLIATLGREASSNTRKNKKWANLDGPVDAVDIENMDTVLNGNTMK